ncbi:hypothetical protein ASG48_16030 [Aurantimonas sp. Leaf443]|nr:hypothetical protein ASG48_16030 [Aurantimonas sp. Leaf443]
MADRHESEFGARRVADMRQAIYFGLALYNVFNLTSVVLMPDIVWLSVALRVALVTPVSLFLAWAIGAVSARNRERLVLGGVLNAYLIPLFLFWYSAAPFDAYTFSEFTLTLVFANMVLALRFRDAVVFTGLAFAFTVLAIATKAGLPFGLRWVFVLQSATACLFALYANQRMEHRRCADYLAALQARLRGEAAEEARRAFQDLAVTDALTGLPNRRLLEQRLDAWFAAPTDIAVMMIDIDHFKAFNDALGHPAGDDCLRRVSEVLERVTAGPDAFCARFGGEEFTVLARGIADLEAARLARALLLALEGAGIAHPARSDGEGVVTASVGIAMRRKGEEASKEAVLSAADRALYEAKRRGRNCFSLDLGSPLPLAQRD